MALDATTGLLQAALHGLSARQRVTADNLSNLETPGYRAGRVTFEDQLRAAEGSGDGSSVQPTLTHSVAPATPNGNNVAIDDEMVSAIETGVRYQLVIAAVKQKFSVMKSSIGPRG
jgi:flagellar basal-body rod protein FlgB